MFGGYVKMSVRQRTDDTRLQVDIYDMSGAKRESALASDLRAAVSGLLEERLGACRVEYDVYYSPQGWFAP